MTQPDSWLVEGVARDAYDRTLHEASRTWASLTEAEQAGYLEAARCHLLGARDAGVARSDTYPDAGHVLKERRLTATVRGTDDRPIERDSYASHLLAQIEESGGAQPRSILTDGEAAAAAALLDELAGIYAAEPLGRLAHDIAARINDRLGI